MKITSLSILALSICMTPLFISPLVAALTCPITECPPDQVPVRKSAPRTGEPAPPLTCTTPDGESMSWKDFEGRAVVLYFHSPRTRNAQQAIDQFRQSLLAAPELKKRCTVLLLVDDVKAAEAPSEALRSTGHDIKLGLSKKHELFQSFGVVAFPTLFIVDGEARVVESVRGYGTMFSFHALAACRLALGEIDREAFDKLMRGDLKPAHGEHFSSSPKYTMARRLIETGKGDAALEILVNFASETPPRPRLIALVAHLQLLAGDANAAHTWVKQLAELEPQGLDTSLLQARLQLAAGDTDAANARLRGLDASNPRVEFVRGLILEHEGRFKDASSMYRDALSSALFLPE